MAPTGPKRARPSFSPPRPGKSSGSKSDKPTGIHGPPTKKRISNGVSKPTQKHPPRKRQRQRGTGGTMRAILDDADEGEGEEESDANGQQEGSGQSGPESEIADGGGHDDDDDNDEDEDDEDENENEPEPASERTSSPEPEFILAEVAQTASKASKSISRSSSGAIPMPLIHRIMQSHFTSPEETSISADARALFGKYVEIFVKEGIRRCVDEKKDREEAGGAGSGVDSGWLEVEDLERVATQLCLDF